MNNSRLSRYLTKTKPEQQKSAAIAYLASLDHIESVAPHISASIVQELNDQRSHLKLIASENYSSLAVQLAMGNLLTDKYAEGYAYHRFYGGCNNVDAVENAAQEELKMLFNAEHAYVQPHSGIDANLLAYWSILIHHVQNKEIEKLGKKTLDELTPEEYEKIRQLLVNQKVLGMSLNSGGHLTHGYKHNVSSKMMQAFQYEVDPITERIDYKALKLQAEAVRPRILLAGYSAHPRKINFALMREIADSVGAVLMVDMAHFSGLVAGKVFTGDYNPVPFAHFVSSTTHKTLRGPRGGFVLCKSEYAPTVNKGCPLILGGPLPHVLAAKAIAFKEANSESFVNYAHRIVENSITLAECLKSKGIRLVTDGTENHMVIMDIGRFGINGRQAENILSQAMLTVNRNSIPFDKNGPWFTSGVRIGTPAITTIGMGKVEMEEIASIIFDVLSHAKPAIVQETGLPNKSQCTLDEKIMQKCQTRVKTLLSGFPLYPEIEL